MTGITINASTGDVKKSAAAMLGKTAEQQALEAKDIAIAKIERDYEEAKNADVTHNGHTFHGGMASAQAVRDKRELMLVSGLNSMQFDTKDKNADGSKVIVTLAVTANPDFSNPDEAQILAAKIGGAYEAVRKARNDALTALSNAS